MRKDLANRCFAQWTAPFRYFWEYIRVGMRFIITLFIKVSGFILNLFPVSPHAQFEFKTFIFQRFKFLYKNTRQRAALFKACQTIFPDSILGIQEFIFETPDHQEGFEFSNWSHPLVSIIVPTYGKIEYTYQCLKSIFELSTQCSYEVIVIDDCSQDNTQEVLARIGGLHVIKNTENIGFLRSSNLGAAAAKGKYLLFLNNDTKVLPGWMDELVGTFRDNPDAGLVGSKLLFPTGRLQEAGGIIWDDGTGWNYGREDDPAKTEYNYLREVDYCSGASIMVPANIFQDLGGFDERYIPAYYEDTDLAFAIREKGKKVFYQPLSRAVHFEGVTSGNDITQGVRAYQEVNRHKFIKKWKEVLKTHGKPGSNVNQLKEKQVQKRILIVDAATPTPDQDSGSVDAFNYMKFLKSLSFGVTFIPLDNFKFLEQYTTDLQRMGVECLYAPYNTNLPTHLKEQGSKYDVVLLFNKAQFASKGINDVQTYCPTAKIIFNTVDLDHLRE